MKDNDQSNKTLPKLNPKALKKVRGGVSGGYEGQDMPRAPEPVLPGDDLPGAGG